MRLVVLVAASIAISTPTLSQDHGAEPTVDRLPAVTVVKAQMREFVERVAVSGTLLPREEVLVFPAVSGYAIAELLVEAGDAVQAGEVLARIDDRGLLSQMQQADAALAQAEAGLLQAQSQVVSAEATLTQTEQALDRARTLNERGSSTDVAYQEAQSARLIADAALGAARNGVTAAEARVAQAQAAYDLVETNFRSAEVIAPVDGVVSVRNGQIGAIASLNGEPIFRIIRDGVVEIEVEVLETDLARIALGDPATLVIPGLQEVSGAVRLISPTVEPATRLGSARIELDATDGLRPGVFASGWITTERRNGLGVPATAVVSSTLDAFVLRVDEDGVLEQRSVAPLILWQDWVEVSGELEAGEEVVASAGAFFTAGDEIRPIRHDDVPNNPSVEGANP